MLAGSLPFALYAVGGAVRDFLAGLIPPVRDWDVCAPGPAEEIFCAARPLGFEVTAAYPGMGSLKLRCEGVDYEFTSFRTDVYSGHGHVPDGVVFTDDMLSDARRRDFTCNAVYYDICGGKFVDPLGGRGAIAERLLVPCIPAGLLFGQDALRILRLCRFCGELSFVPAPGCAEAAAENAAGLAAISPAVLWRELSGILRADVRYKNEGGCAVALSFFKKTGAMAVLFPALCARGEEVAEGAVRAAARAPSGLREEAFLHALGGRNAAEVLRRYGLSLSRCGRAARLIDASGYDGGDLRGFAAANGDILPEVCALRRAVYGDGREEEWLAALAGLKREGVPLSAGELAVRGDDLIACGIAPRNVGKVLGILLGKCLYGGVPNKREELVKIASAYREGK